jgi:hypothetical protein
VKITPALTRKALLWTAGFAGSLLAFGAQQLWSDVRNHETRITSGEKALELLPEVRADVKEIRDSVRRMEGARDAADRP